MDRGAVYGASALIRVAAWAVLGLAAGALIWPAFDPGRPVMRLYDASLILIALAIVNALLVLRRARLRPLPRIDAAALMLVLAGSFIMLALASAAQWFDLVAPPVDRSQDVETLDRISAAYRIIFLLIQIGPGAVMLGWGLWVVRRLRARRRSA